jgi:hypothetical protein
MYITIPEPWLLFCICFAAMLLATFLMGRQSHHFRTIDPVMQKFSMMDLEFPSNPGERTNITSGIYKLNPEDSRATLRALRHQLITDFLLFMPGTYGGIFILCMQLAGKSGKVGYLFFMTLAIGQILCFVLDTIENIYLWRITKPDVKKESAATFFWMRNLEYVKWVFALVGGIGGLSAMAWIWLTGNYERSSLLYVFIFLGEIALFIIASMIGKKKPGVTHAPAPSLN